MLATMLRHGVPSTLKPTLTLSQHGDPLSNRRKSILHTPWMFPRENVIHGAGPKQSDHARAGTISRYAWIQSVGQRLDLH